MTMKIILMALVMMTLSVFSAGYESLELDTPETPERVRLQDGMVVLPDIGDRFFSEVWIYAEEKGMNDVWEKTTCSVDSLDRNYFVLAPDERIRVSGKITGGVGFTLDHPRDMISLVCTEQNVVQEFARRNAGRRNAGP